MRDKRLADLNFRDLLHYGGEPSIQHTYVPPLACSGYCIHCEEKGNVFSNSQDSFDQMSHGCDTSIYETLLEPMCNGGRRIELPIIFLLENPGGNYQNGRCVDFKGYKKRPPVNVYYWSPGIKKWPKSAVELSEMYSDYFAYLMNRYGLKNVYITNLIKCNTINGKWYNYQEARSNCIEKWFKREIEIFAPKFVFSFGDKATNGFKKYSHQFSWKIKYQQLLHPAQRRYSRERMIKENNFRIDRFLKQYHP